MESGSGCGLAGPLVTAVKSLPTSTAGVLEPQPICCWTKLILGYRIAKDVGDVKGGRDATGTGPDAHDALMEYHARLAGGTAAEPRISLRDDQSGNVQNQCSVCNVPRGHQVANDAFIHYSGGHQHLVR